MSDVSGSEQERAQDPGPGDQQEKEVSAGVVAGGSMAEALGGGAAVVLAIIGLAQFFPEYMAPVATLAVGGALLLQGAATGARYSRLVAETSRSRTGKTELATGVTAEFLAGATGLALGIIGLAGEDPEILIPVAVIVFGGGILLGAGLPARLTRLELGTTQHPMAQQLAHDAILGGASAQVLVGVGAVALGIIGLAGTAPLTLSLVALLALGASILVSGSAIAGKMIGTLAG